MDPNRREGTSTDDPSEPDELVALVARCAERYDAEGEVALEDLCREHPAQADELRARVRALVRAGLIGDVPEPGSFPERLGEFRLVRYLGGGGMGAVYLAVQEPLGREVALKLVRPDQLYFPGARERFRREIELVAKLQHPGIVPVHTCGEQGGIPYFAMERVPGCTLAEVLRELAGADPARLQGADLARAVRVCAERNGAAPAEASPAHAFPARAFIGGWIECCVRIAEQVAQALAHAHAHGVLHRDVKPSNVMLTVDGRVLLLDFGLATSEGASRVTRTGSQLGSLPYMAPEQLRGEPADARTDVYALGVTLYELLALRPPYHESSAEGTRLAILRADPPRPRERNRAVPWDVETVCLTAIEGDPARRYAGAADFARDLGNLLGLRPIEAQRPGTALRARRWVQRHPTASVAAMLGFLLLVVAPSVAWWRIRAERDVALVELRARRGLLDFMIDVVEAADPRASSTGEPASVDRVVDVAVSKIREELRDHPRVRMELLANLGSAQSRLGRPHQAVALLEEALELARALDFRERAFLLECKQALAADLIELGQHQRGEELLREIRADLAASGDAEELTLWKVDFDLAQTLALQRRFEEAKAMLETLAADPGAPVHVDGEPRVDWLASLADVHEGLGRFDEALAHMTEAVETSTRVYGREHLLTARRLQALAAIHGDRGQADRALPLLEEVRDIRAAVEAPESLTDAMLAQNLAALYNWLGRLDDSVAEFQRALELCRRHAPRSAQLARAAAGTGAMLLKQGRVDEAEPILREALELSRRYVPRRGAGGAEAPLWLGRCLVRQGEHAEALPLYEEALACTRDDPSVPAYLRTECNREMAKLLDTLGRPADAEAFRKDAQ